MQFYFKNSLCCQAALQTRRLEMKAVYKRLKD